MGEKERFKTGGGLERDKSLSHPNKRGAKKAPSFVDNDGESQGPYVLQIKYLLLQIVSFLILFMRKIFFL
jgi:hypothetical protein